MKIWQNHENCEGGETYFMRIRQVISFHFQLMPDNQSQYIYTMIYSIELWAIILNIRIAKGIWVQTF